MNILEETQFSSTFSLQNKKLQKDRSTLKRKDKSILQEQLTDFIRMN